MVGYFGVQASFWGNALWQGFGPQTAYAGCAFCSAPVRSMVLDD
jgi:hypothetical protein